MSGLTTTLVMGVVAVVVECGAASFWSWPQAEESMIPVALPRCQAACAATATGSAQVAEPGVDRGRTVAAFLDRADDERLPARCVAGVEQARDSGLVGGGRDVAALVARDAERLEERRLGADEAHGEEHEIGGVQRSSSVPGTGANGGSPLFASQWMRSTRASPEKPVVEIAKLRSPPSLNAYDVRSFTGQKAMAKENRTLRRRFAEQFELRHRRSAFPVRARDDAVSPRVAAADHDHVLVVRADRRLGGTVYGAVPARDLHRVVDAMELATGHAEVARHP